jgi:hypothetical protein
MSGPLHSTAGRLEDLRFRVVRMEGDFRNMLQLPEERFRLFSGQLLADVVHSPLLFFQSVVDLEYRP